MWVRGEHLQTPNVFPFKCGEEGQGLQGVVEVLDEHTCQPIWPNCDVFQRKGSHSALRPQNHREQLLYLCGGAELTVDDATALQVKCAHGIGKIRVHGWVHAQLYICAETAFGSPLTRVSVSAAV